MNEEDLPYLMRGAKRVTTESSVLISSSKYLNDIRIREWVVNQSLKRNGNDLPPTYGIPKLIEAVREFMGGPDDLARFAAAPASTLERLREVYWRHVGAAGVDVRGKIFVDKNPLNSLKLPLIARLFPDAKVVFACRDPRDVVLSCFRHRLQMSAPIYELLTLAGAARYYDAVMRLIVQVANIAPIDMCLVRHEDVVTEFAREMKRLCAFLGLQWDPAMGDFALRSQRRKVLTPSVAQLAKGLNTEGLGQWQRYRSHMAPVLPVLKPWLERFLYEPGSDPAARTSS